MGSRGLGISSFEEGYYFYLILAKEYALPFYFFSSRKSLLRLLLIITFVTSSKAITSNSRRYGLVLAEENGLKKIMERNEAYRYLKANFTFFIVRSILRQRLPISYSSVNGFVAMFH